MPKYKIGISRNPEKRAEHLKIDLIGVIPCTNRQYAIEAEMAWHTLLIHHNRQIKGEWFTLDDSEARIMVEKLKDEDDVYIYFNEEIEALLGYDAFEHKNFPTARRKYMKLLHPKE